MSLQKSDNKNMPLELKARYPKRNWRRGHLILLGILGLIAILFSDSEPEAVSVQVSEKPPPVVEASGKLAIIFQEARLATLRIEARFQGTIPHPSPVGIGTGFFVSDTGHVLTAYHVIESQRINNRPVKYVGIASSGAEYPLRLIGFDAYVDLALLQAETDNTVPHLRLAVDAPRPGQKIVTIGNSRGELLEDRSGRVTRLGVGAPQATFADDTIELTASLGPGDSGGPVLTGDGEVIGVVSYISFNPTEMSSEGSKFIPPFLLGLKLPKEFASYAVPVLEGGETVVALLAGESRDVPVIGFSWAGFDYHPLTDRNLNLGRRPGTVIGGIANGGPAADAGLRGIQSHPIFDSGRRIGTRVEADVIVAVDGERTPNFYSLVEVLRRRNVGQKVVLTVQRGKETLRITLELGARRHVFN
jgi:serine protease Do